jgi:hypothetical protein
MRFAFVVTTLLAVPGCLLFFDDGGSRPDQCLVGDEPEIADELLLRDPSSLACQSFGGGRPCDPACGPCPEDVPAEPEKGAALIPPIPSWGLCQSTCESRTAAACAAAPECRVIRDVRCAIDGTCETDFMMCVALDMAPDPSLACNEQRDGWACSRNPSCSALHERLPCPINGPCDRSPFVMCVNEETSPGRCFDPVICAALPPACPAGTQPGVANGCYTGACIPNEFCEASI